MEKYTDVNSRTVDAWNAGNWEWGRPIGHEAFVKARQGAWDVLLTPTKNVPHEWFGVDIRGKRILGLASGGGQQMPIFAAAGAICTVLDYSASQLASENMVAQREGYSIEIVRGDMTQPLPFKDGAFDIIFHPVSNCYVEDILPIWKECHRVLKHGGTLLVGFDNSLNYVFNDDETELIHALPFNPLKDDQLYEESLRNDWGIQFSHTIEEQIGGQLEAGFSLQGIYQDTNGYGRLHALNIPTFYATKCLKP